MGKPSFRESAVRVCASGECVLLREHKAQAPGKGGG